MPNIKSARKRMRTSEEARVRNVAVKTRVKTLRRAFMDAAAAKDAKKTDEIYRAYCSALDKAAKKGVIKKNTAIRRKTRASERLKSIAA